MIFQDRERLLPEGGLSNVGHPWRPGHRDEASLAQSVERKALNLVVVGSSPTVGVFTNRISNLVVHLYKLYI